MVFTAASDAAVVARATSLADDETGTSLADDETGAWASSWA